MTIKLKIWFVAAILWGRQKTQSNLRKKLWDVSIHTLWSEKCPNEKICLLHFLPFLESMISGLLLILYISSSTINEKFQDAILQLTLTRPIGLPLTRPLRKKLRISADSSLIRQNIGDISFTFFYNLKEMYLFSIKWCVLRLVSVNKHRFFLFILISSNEL